MLNPDPSKKLLKGSRFSYVSDRRVDADGIDPIDRKWLKVTTRQERRPMVEALPDVWVEVPLDRLWMCAFRLSAELHRPRVAELRLFPRETQWKNRPAGEWSALFQGVAARAPRQGITKRLLSRVPISLIPKHLEVLTKMLKGEAAAEDRGAVEFAGRVLKIIGVRDQQDEPVRDDPRGRKRDSDELLAQVASAYVEGLPGKKPTKHVQRVHGGSAAVAAGRVARARRRGFLEEGLQGVTSGGLTDKAKLVLARMRRKKAAKHRKAAKPKKRRK